jgi:hypothetical protein
MHNLPKRTWRQRLSALKRRVNRSDARTLTVLEAMRVRVSVTLLALVVQERRRVVTVRETRAYLAGIRQVNRERGLKSHRYRPVTVPVKYTWDAIAMALQAEAMGSRRYADGLTT